MVPTTWLVPQALLTWDTGHGLSTGPSRTHLADLLQRLARTTAPKVRRGRTPSPPVTPCVRTADPWICHRRIPPSSCHSLRADNRALASSRTHLSQRVRPPRGTDRAPQGASSRPSTPISQTLTTEGDIPRGRVRLVPVRGIRRRRGQQSRPRTRHLSPAAQKCPRTRRMPPATAPECGVFMPRPKTPVRRAGFDCRYSPPRQGVTRLLAVTRMAPVIYCTRVGCHWRRVGCTPGRWGLRAVRTPLGQ